MRRAIAVLVALVALIGCYKCVDENCSNVPPAPTDYPAAASRDAGADG